MAQKNDFKVAALLTDGFQEVEFAGPMQALKDAGVQVDVISEKTGEVQAFNNYEPTRTYSVTKTIDQVRVEDYDAVFTPGGIHHPAIIAEEPRFTQFIQQMNAAGKFVTSICRGGLVLAAADVIRGRKVTGAHNNTVGDDWWYLSVKERMKQAGGLWEEDTPAVVDQNLITSRYPGDIPQFSATLIKQFGLSDAEHK